MPVAATVNVAVCPTVIAAFIGWAVIAGGRFAGTAWNWYAPASHAADPEGRDNAMRSLHSPEPIEVVWSVPTEQENPSDPQAVENLRPGSGGVGP